jgi:hypothetical protein
MPRQEARSVTASSRIVHRKFKNTPEKTILLILPAHVPEKFLRTEVLRTRCVGPSLSWLNRLS